MRPNELRKLVGVIVTIRTLECEIHGRILSCTLESVWLIDDREVDVIVPLADVRSVVPEAA